MRTFDASHILATAASNPKIFPDARTELHKAAIAIVARQLKARGMTLEALSGISSTLGQQQFELTLDHLPSSVITSLLKKLDPHHPEKGTLDEGRARKHICALAFGDVVPAVKPAKKLPAKKKQTGTRQLQKDSADFWPTSMTAVSRKRTR